MEFKKGLKALFQGIATGFRRFSDRTDTATTVLEDAARVLQTVREKRLEEITARLKSGKALRRHERRHLRKARADESRRRAGELITLKHSRRRYIVDRHGALRRIVEPHEEHYVKRGVVRRNGRWFEHRSSTPTNSLP